MEGWLLQVIACNLQPLGWVVVGVSAKMAVVNWPTLGSGLAALPCSVWRQSPWWLPPWTACPTFPWSRWRWPAPTLSASQPHQVPTGPWFYLGEQRQRIKRRKENVAQSFDLAFHSLHGNGRPNFPTCVHRTVRVLLTCCFMFLSPHIPPSPYQSKIYL